MKPNSHPKRVSLVTSSPTSGLRRRIVSELDALQAEVDALKRLQAETAAEMDAFPPSPRLWWTGLPALLDRVFKGEL